LNTVTMGKIISLKVHRRSNILVSRVAIVHNAEENVAIIPSLAPISRQRSFCYWWVKSLITG